MSTSRTDRHNNPTAFTTDVAVNARLVLNQDYMFGEPFKIGGNLYHTAKLIGDPIEITIRVIDRISYFTKIGTPRWTYIALPKYDWAARTFEQKRDTIGYHYRHEGGTEMKHLFPNYDITI